jgi:hypothetical protein
MHVDDINRALADKDASGLRDAFRALADYPNQEIVRGSDSGDHLRQLLREVSTAILDDEAQLPRVTRRSIAERTDDPAVTSCGSGAKAVLAFLRRAADGDRS